MLQFKVTIFKMYELKLSRRQNMMNFSRATSRIRWFNGENTKVSLALVLAHRVQKYPEDEDEDASKNVRVFALSST